MIDSMWRRATYLVVNEQSSFDRLGCFSGHSAQSTINTCFLNQCLLRNTKESQTSRELARDQLHITARLLKYHNAVGHGKCAYTHVGGHHWRLGPPVTPQYIDLERGSRARRGRIRTNAKTEFLELTYAAESRQCCILSSSRLHF